MLKWLKSAKEKEKEQRPGLPNPENASTPEKKDLIEKINDIVDKDYEDPNVTPNSGRKSKRGEYSHYTPEQKAKITRFAIDKSACFGNF
jgi:hypothetical protein